VKKGKKIIIIAGIVLLLLVIVGFTVHQSGRNVTVVQTGKVVRQDLSSTVSASGEIKPKTFVNIGANAYGKITRLFVKEGDWVKRGQLLAQIDNIQPEADVAANRASLEASQTDAAAQEAGLEASRAQLVKAQSDLDHAKLDYDRAQGLYKQALIAKQDFDAKKATYDAAVASVAQFKASIAQYKAQKDTSERRISQAQATLARSRDVLAKTSYVAPYDGLITSLPVREGESVVVGIQNALGSTLMTLADMSVITAEIQVDETDIVSVKLGQDADVTIDAMPKKIFHGKVTEIGNNAIVRSTGVSTSQSTSASQEAKDFKVVITVTDPPQNLRPGLSCTAKITTNIKKNILTVPIQALTIRQRGDLDTSTDKSSVHAAAPPKDTAAAKEELQGVFIVRGKKADFLQIATGITGTTDIEVTDSLKEGDEIVTGSYKTLRTIRNGSSIKIDNSTPKKSEES
jgi:HlyD family secretion protein